MVEVPDLEQLEPDDLPSCPWCLENAGSIDRGESTSAHCTECGARLPLQAEWYWENKKVREHKVQHDDRSWSFFTHSHYVEVTRESSQEQTVAQEQAQDDEDDSNGEASSALDW